MKKARIELSIEQTRALDLLEDHNTKQVLYGGQAGGGKSFLICLWQIQRRLTYPGTRGYIGREHLKNLKASVLVTFFDVAKLLGVPFKYNDVKSYIDFRNGSRIVLLDLFDYPADPNWDSLGSHEYTDGAIEEGVAVSKRAAEILITRTRYKHPEFNLTPTQLITCNPGEGWVKDEIVKPYHEGKLDPSIAFIPATLESNPNRDFVKGYKETLINISDQYDKARLLDGDWYATPKTGGEFYRDFDRRRNVGTVYYDQEEPLHLTFDFNVNPYVTLLIHQVEKILDKEGEAIGFHSFQIGEICLEAPLNRTADACKEFTAIYKGHRGGVFVYGDPAGRHEDTRTAKGHNDYRIVEAELASFKPILRVASKAPSVVMRGNFINQVLADRRADCKITIGDQCEKTILDYSQIKTAADGTKAKKKIKDTRTGVTYEKYGHCTDANDYYFISIFVDSYNEYLDGPGTRTYSSGRREHKQTF